MSVAHHDLLTGYHYIAGSEVKGALLASLTASIPFAPAAKFFSVGIQFTDIDCLKNLIVYQLKLVGVDPGPVMSGDNGCGFFDIVDHCLGGGVPDTVNIINNTALGSGKDLEYWIRFYA